MQTYTPITDATLINDFPEAVTGNVETALSNSAGNVFPTSQKFDGRLCYREDSQILYGLRDGTADDWIEVADFNKTPVYVEDAVTTYLLQTDMTDSLSDGSSSKAATAYATKTLYDAQMSHEIDFDNFVDGINHAAGIYTFSDQVEIDRNLPVFKLKSASTGSNTNEKAGAIMMGPSDAASMTFTVKGDGTGYLGLGALDGNNQPTIKVARMDAGQTGLYLYGALTGASSGDFAGSLHSGGTLSTDSNLTVGSTIVAGGDITAFSDRRVKSDIETICDGLDKVLSMRGVNFTRNVDGVRSTGVVAQEVQAVMPNAVHLQDNGLLSVAYGNMVGVLIQAIKELNHKVETYNASV